MDEKIELDNYDWIQDHLYTAVLADIMDSLGFSRQVMRPDIRPLYPGACLVGRAATMLAAETFSISERPYYLELELLDSLKAGEVILCAMAGHQPASIWGELLSTHARARGARGAVIDGSSRDSRAISAMQFPVFATGLSPADSKGRYNVVKIRTRVMAGGVLVSDGDIIVADHDGCVVIPQEIADEVIRKAQEKVNGENQVRDILRRGASIRQVFDDYGIL